MGYRAVLLVTTCNTVYSGCIFCLYSNSAIIKSFILSKISFESSLRGHAAVMIVDRGLVPGPY